MHGTHLEDLTDRIKPRTASSVLLWVPGFVRPSSSGHFAESDCAHGPRRPEPQLQTSPISRADRRGDPRPAGPAGPRRRSPDPARPDPVRRRIRQRRGDAFCPPRQDCAPSCGSRRPQPLLSGRQQPRDRRPDPHRAVAARFAHGRSRQHECGGASPPFASRSRGQRGGGPIGAPRATRQSEASDWCLVERGIELRFSRPAERRRGRDERGRRRFRIIASRPRQRREARSTTAQMRQETARPAANELATAQAELARGAGLAALASRPEPRCRVCRSAGSTASSPPVAARSRRAPCCRDRAVRGGPRDRGAGPAAG